jgi:hypothetical protein
LTISRMETSCPRSLANFDPMAWALLNIDPMAWATCQRAWSEAPIYRYNTTLENGSQSQENTVIRHAESLETYKASHYDQFFEILSDYRTLLRMYRIATAIPMMTTAGIT